MSTTTNRTKKTLAGLAGMALLAFPLAACGSDDEGSSDSSGQVEAVAAIKDLNAGGTTAVKLDAGFVKALESLKVTPGVEGTAELTDGSLVFPITGGNVSIFEKGSVPSYVVGQVQHEGSSLTLTAGGKTVSVGNFNVDPGVSIAYGDVAVDGEIAATSIPIFGLDGGTLKAPKIEGDTATLQGTTVYLTQGAADLLNSTFGVDAITKDIVIGVATITAKIPKA